MAEKTKKNNPDKIGVAKFLTWSVSGAPVAIQTVLLGFFMIYCTNALGMKASLVSMVLFATKVFDGVTDLFAGYIVDRTKSRFGKGRPYEFCIFGIWIMTWALFSVPAQFSTTAKCIWIFVAYSLAQSVFLTLKNAAGNVYMVRAFNNTQKYVKLNSYGGFISIGIVVVFSTVFPMFYAKVINDAAGWSKLIGFITIPMIIIGMLRFFFVKEEYDVDVESDEKVSLKDVFQILKTNKYIYLIGILFLAINIVSGMNVVSYYFLYVVNNVEASGVVSAIGFLTMMTMLLFPTLLKKMSATQLIRRALLLSIISGIVLFLAKDSLPMIIAGNLFLGIVALPVAYLGAILIVECADYNEWKGLRRMEGTLSSVTSFAMKIGQAFGTLLVGILLSASGFNGNLSVQPESAYLMIRLLYSLIPTVIYLVGAFALKFYNLDKLKPQIDADNAKKREMAAKARQ